MKKLFLFCSSLLCATSVMSVNWQTLEENEQFISYFDVDSISVLENPSNEPAQKLTYVMKTQYKTPKKPKTKLAEYSIEKYKGDCIFQKTALSSLTFYINKGRKIETVNLEHEDWQTVKLNSLGEKHLQKACELAF